MSSQSDSGPHSSMPTTQMSAQLVGDMPIGPKMHWAPWLASTPSAATGQILPGPKHLGEQKLPLIWPAVVIALMQSPPSHSASVIQAW